MRRRGERAGDRGGAADARSAAIRQRAARYKTASSGVAAALLVAVLLLAGLRGMQPASAALLASADVTLDRMRATVGDPINLTIAIHYGNGVQVNADHLAGQFAPFEALGSDPPVDQKAASGGTLILHFKIAAYQTGPLEFPALQIPYSAGGQTDVVQTRPVPFTVESVIRPGDPANDVRPLKSQLDLPLPGAPPLVRIGVAVLLLALLALAFAIWQRSRVRPPAKPDVEPAGSPEEAAQAELERIAAQDYLARGDYRTQYALIAACIRRYITERYGFQASALTTAELTDRMALLGVGRWRARLVADLLAECDAVHYAHYLPAPARAEADLQMAFEIVDLSLSQQTRQEDGRVEAGG